MITRSAMPRAGGFTLLEVMLAMAIVAIMSTLVWASFGRLLRVTGEIEEADQYWQGVRVALNRVAREVSAAFISDDYDPNRYRRDDPQGRPTFFLLEDNGDRDRLAFTAFVNRRLYRDEKSTDQAVVEYHVDTDDEGRQHLYRRAKTLIDEDWDRGGESYVLLEDVKSFEVEWWNPDDESWERDWDTRDSDHHDRIPSRFRIRVTAVDPLGGENTFTTQTRVMLTRPLGWE